MFNGHTCDGDPEGELPGDNGEGDHENGEGDRIASKGQRSILKGEPLSKQEPDLFVSSIFVLGSAFPTNTKNNKQFLPLAQNGCSNNKDLSTHMSQHKLKIHVSTLLKLYIRALSRARVTG